MGILIYNDWRKSLQVGEVGRGQYSGEHFLDMSVPSPLCCYMQCIQSSCNESWRMLQKCILLVPAERAYCWHWIGARPKCQEDPAWSRPVVGILGQGEDIGSVELSGGGAEWGWVRRYSSLPDPVVCVRPCGPMQRFSSLYWQKSQHY